MPGAEFDDILAAARSGAEWAITCLYRDLNPLLVRYLDSRAAGMGEDLAQEVWLGAAPGLAGFVGDERQFRSWLFTIAHRRLIAHWRHTGRRPSSPLPADELDALTAASVDPDDLVAREAIAELIAGLTDEQAEVLLLRVVAGLRAEEVAAILGKRPGAVRTTQHRALRRIAGRLAEKAVTP